MSARPYMKVYVGDLIGDTMHLSAEEFGAYTRLLYAMWSAGGPLPLEPSRLAHIAGVSHQRWRTLWPVIEPFCAVRDGMVGNARLELELEKSAEISRARSASARSANQARSSKNKAPRDANATQTVPNARAYQGHSHIEGLESGAGAQDLDVLAARIYDAAHPAAQERGGKDPSCVVWALRDIAAAGEDPAVVTDACVAYFQHPDQIKENGRYAVAPARAVERRKWEPFLGRPPRPMPSLASRETAPGPAAPGQTVEWQGRTWVVPPGGTAHIIGTKDLPGIRRQWDWMEAFTGYGEKWLRAQGPRPGEAGCRVWPEIIAHFMKPATGGPDV